MGQVNEKKITYVALPTLAQFHVDNAFVRGVQGPVGSGKSVGCCMEIIRRACDQKAHDGVRRSRWVAIRNSYPQLRTTTIKTWAEWMPETTAPITYTAPITCRLRRPLPDGTQVDMELFFLSLDSADDVKKLLSMELTGGWLNEAREIPKAVLDMLTGRVGRYPPKSQGGPTWSGIIMDTNPPDTRGWWYRMAEIEKPDGWRFYKQPPALLRGKDGKYIPNPKAENVENQPLGYDYWLRQIAGKDPEWIKVYVMGEYGSIFDGKPVYENIYSDSRHCSKDSLGIYKGLPLRLGWDFGLCYSADTEVLTESGWKFFADVDETRDRVATRCPTTGEMTYVLPNFKVARRYKGPMLEWANTEVNFCVTPEHRVPFTYRDSPKRLQFAEARWLADHMGGHHYVDLRSTWRGTATGKSNPLNLPQAAFAEFMGLFLSEGSADKYRIQIAQKTQRKEMQAIIDATGLGFKWNSGGKDGEASCWRLNSAKCARMPLFHGNAHTKRVPDEIRMAEPEVIRRFLMAYTLGDGHIRTQNGHGEEHTIFTVSPKMADDLMELAQKVGWNSSLRRVKPQDSTIYERGGPRVIHNEGGYSICIKKCATRAELLRRNFREVAYDGMVYCLNVLHHTLYVRRNGKPSWNGNSPSCVFLQQSPNGQIRVLREFMCENGGLREFVNTTVKPALANEFAGMALGSWGDPAGVQRSQVDEATCIAELGRLGIPTQPAHTNDFLIRRQAVITCLTRMIGDQPGFILDPSCKILREGFLGGYQFARVRVSGSERYHDEPLKNFWSHTADALQYAIMGIDASCTIREELPPIAASVPAWG